MEEHKTADHFWPCWMHKKWIIVWQLCNFLAYRYSQVWKDQACSFLIFILMHNIEIPRGPQWNTGTVYIHNKALTLKIPHSDVSSLDKHHQKTDNTMLQMRKTKEPRRSHTGQQLGSWLFWSLCVTSELVLLAPQSILGHLAMSQGGSSGILVGHCWQGANCRETDLMWCFPWLVTSWCCGCWWTFSGENTMY